MRHTRRIPLIAALLLLPALALGQSGAPVDSSVEFGDYELYYSLVPSAFLGEQVAAALDIARANNRALVNISVRRKSADGGSQEQEAQVSGSYSDLIQPKQLAFREVREPGAIYYLAEFRHGDRETLRFDIEVTPPGGPSRRVTFTRTLYIDE